MNEAIGTHSLESRVTLLRHSIIKIVLSLQLQDLECLKSSQGNN